MNLMDLRGGDQWYNVRPQSLSFRAAVVVHRLGVAGSHEVADACGISLVQANEVLRSCLRRPHLYHIRRIAPGRYAPCSPDQDVDKMRVLVPRGAQTHIRHPE